jgi:hypothetical protein
MRIAVVVLLLALSACTPDNGPAATPTTTNPSPPSLTEIDSTRVGVARAAFCDRVAATAVDAAVGKTGAELTSWNNGDPLPAAGPGEVAHEYGCRWDVGRTTALAWVFAPPVTVSKAEQLIGESTGGKCAALPGGPKFGAPSVAVRCDLNAPTTVLQLHGLFGDAWLSCALIHSGAGTNVTVPRLRDWCAAVLDAAKA